MMHNLIIITTLKISILMKRSNIYMEKIIISLDIFAMFHTRYFS